MIRAFAIIAAACVCIAGHPSDVLAHPLHTTFVELSYSPKGEAVAMIKVFSEDFMRRVTRGARVNPADGAALQKLAASYIARTLLMNASTGQSVPLTFCGWKRSADLIFICMKGPLKGGLAGLRLRDAILSDVFNDQINVLQAELGGSRKSMLFMNGSGEKQLR